MSKKWKGLKPDAVFQRLTNIDLTDLQIGEKLTIYRGSSAFLTGPCAAGYVGVGVITEIRKKSAIIHLPKEDGSCYSYRLRFSDARICRIPNGELTMLYAHAREGKPTRAIYLTDAEYGLVRKLLGEEAIAPSSSHSHRLSLSTLERMEFHDTLIQQ